MNKLILTQPQNRNLTYNGALRLWLLPRWSGEDVILVLDEADLN